MLHLHIDSDLETGIDAIESEYDLESEFLTEENGQNYEDEMGAAVMRMRIPIMLTIHSAVSRPLLSFFLCSLSMNLYFV